MRTYLTLGLSFCSLFLVQCLESGGGPSSRCGQKSPVSIDCGINEFEQIKEVLIVDSFERDFIVDDVEENGTFWWRTVINDQGKIYDGIPARKVSAAIMTDEEMGKAFDRNRALYFYGREGSSIHNIYVVSQGFDLAGFENVDISFRYLPIDLDDDDYLSVEVCNDTVENCGMGDQVSLEGLNSSSWVSVFKVGGEGQGLNGHNHTLADWRQAKIHLDLFEFASTEFVFRFNVRVDEGFKKDLVFGEMEDGVAIDAVQVNATVIRKYDQ